MPTTMILFIVCIALIFSYQHKTIISATFPTTIATIQKMTIVPDFFAGIGSGINSKYNLSSMLIALQSNLREAKKDFTAAVIIQDDIIEKPVKILINKVGISADIINPDTVNLEVLNDALKSGAVRYPTSGLLGEDKNIFIFGHSTSLETENLFYKTFNNLNNLVAGDEIILQSAHNEYIYKVVSVTLTNTDEGIINFDTGKKLTLSTCATLGKKEDRYIVEADFVKKTTLIPNAIIPIETESAPAPDTNQVATIAPQAGEREDSIYDAGSLFAPFIEEIENNNSGQIDLAVIIDAVGILDEDNQFIATSTLRVNNKIAVKFTITNIGDKKSESWYFNAVLPTSPMHIFHSKTQQALAPAEKIEFTMGFDKPKIGKNQVIVINVDPSGGIKESDKDNNIAKELITVVE